MKTKITDFQFQFSGYGHYKVTYTSPKTGKTWTADINDMQIIDATKNAEQPTQVDLNSLKSRVKNG